MAKTYHISPSASLFHADCRDALRMLPDNCVDSVVTDPPYHLTSIVKRFGKVGSAPAQFGRDGAFARASAGFMGKEWDGGDIAFQPELWAEVLRVLKPGGHIVAFGASRGYHRMACAIEDVGFEIRDSLMWLYGTGFPKSHDISKAAGGDAARWAGWGTALKPAFEPIVLARKPLSESTVAANVMRWGTGALNIDGCRVHTAGSEAKAYTVKRLKPGATLNKEGGNWRPSGDDAIEYQGMTKDGRWPANVCHDSSDEVIEAFPDGSAARFFYSAKASKSDRAGSKHPTVKPISLKQWLARLITPPNGVVLDPFAGSGTTGAACALEGFACVMIEREDEYVQDIVRRLRCSLQ